MEITSEKFWEIFKTSTELPTTAAVSPGDFANIFTELAKTTNDIVCMLVSQKLSATNDSAVQARAMVRSKQPDLNIEIVDTKTSTGALGFIVLEGLVVPPERVRA